MSLTVTLRPFRVRRPLVAGRSELLPFIRAVGITSIAIYLQIIQLYRDKSAIFTLVAAFVDVEKSRPHRQSQLDLYEYNYQLF